MKNKIQNGKVLDFLNGTGAAIASGSMVIFGALFGIAVTDIGINEVGAVDRSGVFELPKAAGAITQGQKLYWDDTAKVLTATAASNVAVGAAVEAAITGAATAKVLLVTGI